MRKFLFALLMLAGLTVQARAAHVTVAGRSVHYTIQGSGPAIIFVHGWTCDETTWSRQVPAFARKYRVITLDLPGHGRSDPPARGDFSINAFALAVEAVRLAANVDRVVLVGHSMGASVIRRYALDHSDRVAGLVAVDGPLDVRPFATWPTPLPPMTAEARRQLVESMFVPATPPALRNGISAMMLGTSEATALGSSGSMFDLANQSDQIIHAPALTIYAGKPLFEINRNTKEMLPQWSWIQIGGTGHFVMMEKPEQFNRALATFLARRVRYARADAAKAETIGLSGCTTPELGPSQAQRTTIVAASTRAHHGFPDAA